MRTARKLFLLTLTVVCLTTLNLSEAKKPDNPGGGGDGGGGQNDSARFSVTELPVEGLPVVVTDPDANDIVTVAVDSDEAGYVSAAYVLLDRSSGIVLESGFLPEPLFVDPNDGVMKNGGSGPIGANSVGEIVGYAQTFDPDLVDDVSPPRAIYWSDDGDGYDFEVLPILPGFFRSSACGINSSGDIVGFIGPWRDRGKAVLWEAGTHNIVDLNTPAIAAQGWELFVANDINDAGLIVGSGYLNGVSRGYLLDRDTETVWPTPLIGPADQSDAYRINEMGRVIGTAWDGESIHYGTDPDFVLGYSWDPFSPDAVTLPSVTENTGHAFYLNDFNAVTGNSFIPIDDYSSTIDSVPTLWEIDANGNVNTTELQNVIEKKSYTLQYCGDINNDGWIGVKARTFIKRIHRRPAVLLIPNN
ncbi:MAG: hypothetical protein HUJ26_07995 [Planctomycetaceae bacterium]|nr:hypothetical protein [Planctomycetaceae bacterium]